MLISKIYFKVYRYPIIVPDCFLIFWFCIKGNQVYYTWITYTPALLASIQLLFSFCMKYVKIQGFSDSIFYCMWAESYLYFPVFGNNLWFCPNIGKYRYNSVHIQENKDLRKHIFRHISCSILLNIFNHNLDLHKNISFDRVQKLFMYEYMNCLTVRKLKVQK